MSIVKRNRIAAELKRKGTEKVKPKKIKPSGEVPTEDKTPIDKDTDK